jgi:hypothetical protein
MRNEIVILAKVSRVCFLGQPLVKDKAVYFWRWLYNKMNYESLSSICRIKQDELIGSEISTFAKDSTVCFGTAIT